MLIIFMFFVIIIYIVFCIIFSTFKSSFNIRSNFRFHLRKYLRHFRNIVVRRILQEYSSRINIICLIQNFRLNRGFQISI